MLVVFIAVFVMSGVVLHSLLFLWSWLLFFTHCFLTWSLTLPWAIAGFLDPFYTFSPAHCRGIRGNFILTFPVPFSQFHRERYGFERAFSNHRRFFYAPSPHFWHNLLFSRSPWEAAILSWSLQGFMLILKTQIQLICLFDSQQSAILTFRRIRI